MGQGYSVLLKSDFQQLDAFRHGQRLMNHSACYFEIRQFNGSAWVRIGGATIYANRLVELHKSNLVLQNALHNMLRMVRFSEEYANLLQEYISPEDYDAAMSQFQERTFPYTRIPRSISDGEIAQEAKVVLEATGEELDSEELAEILNLNALAVEKAMKKYSKQGKYNVG